MPERAAAGGERGSAEADRAQFYGGQAVVEGVMMRGRDLWTVAVRQPDGEIHVESHRIDSIVKRHPWLGKPGFRGVIALGQALSIGMKALSISASRSAPEEERLSSRQMGVSMTIAGVLFIGLFVVGPAVAFRWVQRRTGGGVWINVGEGVFRVLLFLAYLWVIGRAKEIRRVFEYHGAEHKTIAAYEHGEPLEPEIVDRYSTLHVRCGTNFLLIVMVLTILIFALFGNPGIWWRIGSRIIAIPLIAGLAFEMLRLGARYPDSAVMRALMTPGLWLQKITTKPPAHDQIEVAIASFNEVVREEAEMGDEVETSHAAGPSSAADGGERNPEQAAPLPEEHA